MESNINSNSCELITRAICNQYNQDKINLDMVLQVIDKIETLTGCKLYNKDQLTKQLVELSEENFTNEAKKAIIKNIIPQVDFNTLFKSNMDFTLIFKEDDIIILYKNKVVRLDDLEQIKSSLITTNLTDFPIVYELYLDNICQVITQFINKDISVQYYCTNIPEPYWKLFQIKCNKYNKTFEESRIKCQELEKIVTGEYFKKNKEPIQIIGQATVSDNDKISDELKVILMQIEEYENNNKNTLDNSSAGTLLNNLSDSELKALDDIYRMEVMSYLNDNEIMQYLNTLEKIDEYDKEPKYTDKNYIIMYLTLLSDSIESIKNNIAQFYYVYKLYYIINNASWFIKQHDEMRKNITIKIIEFTEEIYILKSGELKLYYAVINMLNKSKELIDSIEKEINPDYVPKWKNNNQQIIFDQIITNVNNKNQIDLDSDDEIDENDNNNDLDINYEHYYNSNN